MPHLTPAPHPTCTAAGVHTCNLAQIGALLEGIPILRREGSTGETSFTTHLSVKSSSKTRSTTIVTNGVSLHPIVPAWSVFKLNVTVPMLKMVTDYLNPQWGLEAPTLVAKLVRLLVNLTHHECNNPVCKQVSFTYGSGFPALWRHEHLNDATHEWLKHEFGNVPLRFFQQMARCVRQGNMVSFERLAELPADFCAQAPQTDARFAFLTGRRNRCFLYESQVTSFEWCNSYRQKYHTFHLFPTYGHLDVFMGRNAVHDTYPTILKELDR